MQSAVFAFIVINMNGDFLDEANGLAVGGFPAFEIGGEDVVGLAGRNALGKFAHVIGNDLPAGLLGFIGSAADFHRDAVHGMIVRTPDRSGNESVGLAFGLRGGEESLVSSEHRQEKYDQEETQGKSGNRLALAKFRRSHRRRFPPLLLRLLRRILLPRLSIQADWE